MLIKITEMILKWKAGQDEGAFMSKSNPRY